MNNLISKLTAHKKLVLSFIVAIFAYLSYIYLIPTVYDFKCEGTASDKDASGNKSKTYVTEYVAVKKYLHGLEFTLNDYKRNECSVLDDEIVCGLLKNDGKDWLAFDFVKTQLSGGKDISYIKQLNLDTQTFANLECAKIKRAID